MGNRDPLDRVKCKDQDISDELPATIPMPSRWHHHVADFEIDIGRSWSRLHDSEEALQELYKNLGAQYDPKTGRPLPFQTFDYPYHIIYTPIPALVSIYSDGRLEENYCVLLRTISLMQAVGVKVRPPYRKGDTPTYKPIYDDCAELLRELLARSEQGDMLLEYQAPSRSLFARFYRLLARSGLVVLRERFPIRIVLPEKGTASDNLFEAVGRGDIDDAQVFLTWVDVDTRNEHGQTALAIAVRTKQVAVARFLVEHQADVNACPASGWTPLMSAAMVGSQELLTLLLANGATVNAHTLTCQTALRVAVVYGHDRCVRLLIDKGATLDPLEDTIRYTTLMFACTQCRPETVELLIEQGADVNVMALDRMTPLRCAEAAGREDLVDLLHKHGATI